MEEYNTKAAAGVCSPGIVKALTEILQRHWKIGDDFKDPFVRKKLQMYQQRELKTKLMNRKLLRYMKNKTI